MVLCVIVVGFGTAIAQTVTPHTFRDLDGDGFSDDLYDKNADGIPDLFQQKKDSMPTNSSPTNLGVLAPALVGKPASLHSNKLEFRNYRDAIRDLITEQLRFLPAAITPSGNLSSTPANSCAGGICSPH